MVSKGTSIRLDDELRSKLNAIAEREIRTLSNQVTFFLRHAVEDYEEKSELTWFNGRYCNADELEYRIATPDDPEFIPGTRTVIVRPKFGDFYLRDNELQSASDSEPD
jgi:predicted transcriptional regulator